MNEKEPVTGIIWAEGIHGIWVDKEPKQVKVTDKSIKKTFDTLQQNLPIPIGIDHLEDEILNKNPILKKLDLLNVGTLNSVKLTDNGIEVEEAVIENPAVMELYATGQLPSFSIVSDIYTRDCPELSVDYLEEYSDIKRVDFVERGGCQSCKVNQPQVVNARSIVDFEGDDTVKDEKKKGESQDSDVSAIIARLDKIEERITALVEEIKTNALKAEEAEKEDEGEATKTGEAKDPSLEKLEKEMEEIKTNALKAEAKAVVKGYLNEGKIAPKQVEQHEALAFSNPDGYKELMNDAPVIIDMTKQSKKDAEAEKADKDDDTSYKAYQKATGQLDEKE